MALTFTIGIVGGTAKDYLPYVDFHSFVTEDSVQVAADTMSFSLTIYSQAIDRPLAGMEVIFKDGSTIEFAGEIINVAREFSQERSGIIYQCTCRDYVYFLNRRLVNNSYVSQAAGLTIKAILTDLYNASSADKHYLFFKDNVTNISDGPVMGAIVFNNVLPSNAFDQIAQATGMQWWIQFDKNVYFKTLNSYNSPLTDITLNIDTDLTTYFDYREEEDIDGVGTQVILQDIDNRSTATQQDQFIGSDGKDHNGQTNKIFFLSRKPFTLADVTNVKKATVNQTLLSEDIDGSPTGGQGGTTDVYVMVKNEGSYVRFANANVVSDAAAIEVNYRYSITDNSEDTSPSGVSEMKERTGGDGVHQFLYSQFSGLAVADVAELDRIKDILLARKSVVLRRGSFKSWIKGWQAGQVFIRRWDQEQLLDAMFVISVAKRVLTPANDPILADNVIESTITFSNIPYGVAV